MPDTDPVTLRHISAASGMSVAGVAKILRGDYKATTPKGRRRVEEITALARRMGYIANGSAKRLRSGRHQAMAVLVPVDPQGHPEYISYEFINGIALALGAEGYALSLLCYPRTDPAFAVARLAERTADAVIVLDGSTPELERFLGHAAIPAIAINVEPHAGLPTICRDEQAAARAVMDITIGLGYRRFIIAGGWDADSHFSYRERAAGIRAAASAVRGVTCIYNGVATWAGGFEESIRACAPDERTLVLAIDSTTALRLPGCLPAQQPLACCDESHQFVALAPWLTRACFERALMGRTAGELMLGHIADRSRPLASRTFTARVLVGESTPARPPGGRDGDA